MPKLIAKGNFEGWFEWSQYMEVFKNKSGVGEELIGPVGSVTITEDDDCTTTSMTLEMFALKKK